MKKIVLLAFFGFLLFGHASVFAENFNTSDLEGTWYLFDTTVDPSNTTSPVFWTYGEFVSNASGTVLSGSYFAPDGSEFTVIDGKMMIDKKGVMSGVATVDMGGGITATAMFPHGKLDGAKTNGSLVSLMTVAGAAVPNMGIGSFIKDGGTFMQADLEGEWHGQVTLIHSTLGPTSVYGIFNIDKDGNVISGSYSAPSGITVTVIPAGSELVMDGDGFVSGIVVLSIDDGSGSPETVFSIIARGKMDQKKRAASFVTLDVTDPNDPVNTLLSLTNINLVKNGGSFADTDLAGDWYTYSLVIEPSTPAVYWIRGQYRTDNSGNISNGFYKGPDGTVINTTGGAVSLDNEGEISGNINMEGGDAFIVNGKLDQGKTYGIFGTVDDTGWMNGMTTGVMIKETCKFPWATYLPAIINEE